MIFAMTLFHKTLLMIFLAFFLSTHGPSSAAAGEVPTPARVVLSEAQKHMENDAPGRALEILEGFQARGKKNPDPNHPDPRGYHHPEVYFFIGNIHFTNEAYEKAQKAYQQALERDPAHTPARLNLARLYYEQEKYRLSAENFSTAYETSPEKQAEYLYYAAIAWLMGNAFESSVNAFERLLGAHPDQIKPEWRENLVHVLLSLDRQEKALSQIEILSETYEGEKRIQWQEIRLYQYLRMNMQDRAEEYALELTRTSPENEKWWKALAHVALARNNYKNALVALTIYAYLAPMTPDEKKLLADLNLQVGIPVMAAPAYEAVMDEKPDKTVLQKLIIAYQQMEKQEKALETIAAFEGHEDEPELMMLKGDILYSMERYADAAKAYLQAAKKENRQTGRAFLMAGYAAWHINDISSARKAFEQAAAVDSQKKEAAAALEQLREMD